MDWGDVAIAMAAQKAVNMPLNYPTYGPSHIARPGVNREGMKPVSADALSAEFHGLLLPMGLRVDRLQLAAGATRLEADPFAVQLARPGAVQATLKLQDVASFLDAKAPGNLKDFRLYEHDGDLKVTAKAPFVVPIPVEALCRLEIVNQKQLHVKLLSVQVMGGQAKGMVEGILEKQNPILDAADLPVDIVFRSVEIRGDQIIVKGDVLGA